MHFLKSRFIKYTYNTNLITIKALFSSIKPPWDILFFGTDTFSVSSLKLLNQDYKHKKFINKLEVVTSMKHRENSVEKFAKKENLRIHKWPIKLQENEFDLGVAVSFGVLIPEDIINKFPLGILNVHASLLPRWRGAAPIIYTIAYEDEITGVTIMKIHPKKFDVGEIIKQSSIKVQSNIKLPELYEQLASLGASTLVSSIHELPLCLEKGIVQPDEGITYAPKIGPNMAQVKWNEMSAKQIYALWRALYNLYPLTTIWKDTTVKLHDIGIAICQTSDSIKMVIPGMIEYNRLAQRLDVQCKDGNFITVSKIGLPGKKPMTANDFNNGYLSKEFIHNRKFN